MSETAEKKAGEFGYINKDCWLAKSLNYPPSKHCQYCELRFEKCLFFHYLIISLILISLLAAVSFLFDGGMSKSMVIMVFVLVITYGYFFDKSTENIIKANFAQRKVAKELEELSENLQQKVDEQTKDIRRAYEVEKCAKEQLEALGDVKNQFLMTVQHHLRTPLTSMMGYADLLLDGAFGKTPKKITEVIRRFEETTVSLIKMVNDFLDVTQFQLGKEVVSLKDEVNLCPFFKEIFKDLELEANKKGIYLKIEKPEKKCSVKADEPKLRAAIMNIFDNSVKYTKKGGVTVKVEADEKNVKIDIRDTGMGIPKEKLETLFDITFERSEDAKKHFTNGKGIGLYLSSRIIKAHNGKIWAESEGLEKGSVFHIVLPIDKNN